MKSATDPIDLEAALDRLYARAPEDFVGVRNELARALRDEGRQAEAQRVRALRRPTLAAWAMNQLSRRHPAEVRELVLSGRELRLAQRRMLSGVHRHGLRETSRRRREAVELLTSRTLAILEALGRRPEGYKAQVAASLEAASMDADAAELLEEGRVDRELVPPTGFTGLTGLALVPDAAQATPGPGKMTGGEASGADREARGTQRKAPGAGRKAPGTERVAPATDREARETDRKAPGKVRDAPAPATPSSRALAKAREREAAARAEADESRQDAERAHAEARAAEVEARRLERKADAARRRAELATQKAERAARQATRRQETARRRAEELIRLEGPRDGDRPRR